MKVPQFLLAMLAATPSLAAQTAHRATTPLPQREVDALETLRRDVWVHWFGGDTAALRRVLAPELVAISPDSELWQDLEASVAGSARYKANGGSLAAVEFSNTTVHHANGVVIMFSRYAAHLVNNGAHTEQKGRATEVFVKSNGAWVHTSWHIDVDP